MTDLSKARSDAWDASLTEAQRWQTYAKFRGTPWFQVSKWAAEEFGIEAPSRTALYRWAARMRELESAHRIEQAIVAREEVDALAAAAGQNDARLIDAYKSLAADVAMRNGDAALAGKYTKLALSLAESQTRRIEVAIKERSEARATTAEKRAAAAEARAEELQRELTELRAALAEAGRSQAVDPAAVAKALDAHLGRAAK